MAIPTLITGDDISFAIRLTKKNNLAFSIDSGAIIKVRIVSSDKESAYTPEIIQATSNADADLANALIIVIFSSADTIDVLHQGNALLEIQVNDGGKLTWFTPIKLYRGQIA